MSLLTRLARVPATSNLYRVLSTTSSSHAATTSAAAPIAASNDEDFFSKNNRLKRPMSPFMIYRIQLTSGLSITHRLTGAAGAVLLQALAIWEIWLPSYSFPQLLASIQNNVSPSIIFTAKGLIFGSLLYHTFNGIRHLLWDMGYGFKLRELYLSGYVVLALTVLATGLLLINN